MFLYPEWIIALLKAAIGTILFTVALIVIATLLKSIYLF
jgi:hypothetical protein